MEYKIGQVFEINGIWYQFVEDNRDICKGCVFYQSKIKCTNPDEDVKCSKWHREDVKDGHFVRLLPIGDVYEQGGARWQQYKCIEKPNTEDKRVYIAYTDSDIGLIVSIRQTSSSDAERKIGEIFEYNDEFFQCVESSGCALCAFNETDCDDIDTGCCEVNTRSDRKSVIFKRLEKVGGPVTVKGRTFQKLTSDNNSCKECVFNVPNKACCKNSYIEGICDDNGFWIEIKQNKEDMNGHIIRTESLSILNIVDAVLRLDSHHGGREED